MGENFLKFKRKAFTVRLIKSILLGISAGMILVGVFLLLGNFEAVQLELTHVILIGVGGMLAVGGIGYLLLHRSDKALAKRLDADFSLNEKVQTMLAYTKHEGTIFDLQREDANASLGEIPTKRFKFKRLWIYILCLLVGATSLAGGILVHPVPVEEPELPEEAFALTDIQQAAMLELIAYVENSQMQSPYKENVATSLQELLASLQEATLASEKDAALETAVDYIYQQTDDSSAAVELMDALWRTESESCKRLAEALNYYEWMTIDSSKMFSNEMADFRTSLVHADTVTSNPDKEKMAAETGELLLKMETNISVSLMSSKLSETDDLYIQINRLATANETYEDNSHMYGCSVLAEQATIIGYDNTQKELDTMFSALNGEIYRALEQHLANTGTGEYALTKLRELFFCALPKFERPNFYVATEGDDFGDDEGGGGVGGGIGGGTVYGSDDLVLDPITNTYVEYGTILDKYYALMFGKVDGGAYTEDEKEAMEKYFAILYGGFEEEGE